MCDRLRGPRREPTERRGIGSRDSDIVAADRGYDSAYNQQDCHDRDMGPSRFPSGARTRRPASPRNGHRGYDAVATGIGSGFFAHNASWHST
jgi:hypothetical protein